MSTAEENAFRRGLESADLKGIREKLSEHFREDDRRFTDLSNGLKEINKESTTETRKLGEKIDKFITKAETKEEVSSDAAAKAMTQKQVYLMIIGSIGSTGILSVILQKVLS